MSFAYPLADVTYPAYNRGEQLFRDHAATVITAVATGRSHIVVGMCVGSNGDHYSVTVTFEQNSKSNFISYSSTCTCPVQNDCKHGVALVLTFQHSNGLAATEWAALFASWFNPPIESGPQFATPVAEFSFGKGTSTTIATGGTVTTVGHVRQPLFINIAKESLPVNTELKWNILAHNGYSEFTAQHNRALRDVARILLPTYRPSPAVDITHESTCALWKAVDILRSNNITMTCNKKPVVFREEPVYLGFNTQQDDQGGWRVRARLLTSHPLPTTEEPEGADDFTVLGADYHGLAWQADETLHLAPLSATPPLPWLQLALRGGVDIPAAEAARFAAEVLSKLSPSPSR